MFDRPIIGVGKMLVCRMCNEDRGGPRGICCVKGIMLADLMADIVSLFSVKNVSGSKQTRGMISYTPCGRLDRLLPSPVMECGPANGGNRPTTASLVWWAIGSSAVKIE